MKKLPAPDNQRQPSEEELSLAAYLAAKPAPQFRAHWMKCRRSARTFSISSGRYTVKATPSALFSHVNIFS